MNFSSSQLLCFLAVEIRKKQMTTASKIHRDKKNHHRTPLRILQFLNTNFEDVHLRNLSEYAVLIKLSLESRGYLYFWALSSERNFPSNSITYNMVIRCTHYSMPAGRSNHWTRGENKSRWSVHKRKQFVYLRWWILHTFKFKRPYDCRKHP